MNNHLPDILNLISKISIRKAINIVKVVTGFYLSRLLRRPIIFGLPVSLSIEPTTSCNLRCPECPSGLRSFTRPTGMLNKELFANITQQIHQDILYMTFYFQGEPFLNPEFLDMINLAAKKNIYTATSTNAHFLDRATAKKTVESGLDRLIISIDGTTQEVYQQYRKGGHLEKVIEGAKNIVHWKKVLKSSRPYLVFQFLVVAPNEHQTSEVIKLAKEIGIDNVVFKTAQIYDFVNGSELIPKQAKFSRYEKNKDGKYYLKNKLLNHCWKLWHSSVITWNGTVVPCCFDKDAAYPMGNLSDNTFAALWKSEPYNIFRKSVLLSRKENDICTNCSEGTTVWS